MTTITFIVDENDKYQGFEASGHAGYSRFGKDIVCAAVSALLETHVNSVDELTKAHSVFEADENTGYMKFTIKDYDNSDVQLLYKSLRLGLEGIEDSYPKNLKLTNRRCKP